MGGTPFIHQRWAVPMRITWAPTSRERLRCSQLYCTSWSWWTKMACWRWFPPVNLRRELKEGDDDYVKYILTNIKYKVYILINTLVNLQQGSLVSWPKIVQHRVQLEGSGCWSFCSHISHSPKFHFSIQITGPGIVRCYTLILRTFKLPEISDASELESTNNAMQHCKNLYILQ